MNKKLKYFTAVAAGCVLAGPIMANSHMSGEADHGTDFGKVDFHVKSMHILGDDGNGYDPSEGTAYLVKLKYLTPSWNGAKLGIGFYNNGDLLNLTDFDKAASDPDKRLARGMFVNGTGEETSQMGELYVNYAAEKFEINAGRQIYKTPLTTISYSTMPNFHTAFGISTTALEGFKFSFDQVTQMSFGARAATDFGLIGEGTSTAGAAVNPLGEFAKELRQAKFFDISVIATDDDSEDTNGISVLNATYNGVKNLQISAWNYYADDISNTFYLDGGYGMPVGTMKLKLQAQYMNQTENGDLVEKAAAPSANNIPGFVDGIDFNLFGLKATLKGKKWMAFAAYNKSSGDTGMYNSWGGDPAYTSSIFSRNAYREEVDAFKIGGKYSILKNLAVVLTHADYGQSDTTGKFRGQGFVTPETDAKETDIILVYKPWKKTMLKLFHARRTSEYDDAIGSAPTAVAQERTQAHTRLIVSHTF